jgi:WD40 repeat-containing protein SMU1
VYFDIWHCAGPPSSVQRSRTLDDLSSSAGLPTPNAPINEFAQDKLSNLKGRACLKCTRRYCLSKFTELLGQEMIELRELDTAKAILRQTQAMTNMKLEDPERYSCMEHLSVRTYFDPKEVCLVRAFGNVY